MPPKNSKKRQQKQKQKQKQKQVVNVTINNPMKRVYNRNTAAPRPQIISAPQYIPHMIVERAPSTHPAPVAAAHPAPVAAAHPAPVAAAHPAPIAAAHHPPHPLLSPEPVPVNPLLSSIQIPPLVSTSTAHEARPPHPLLSAIPKPLNPILSSINPTQENQPTLMDELKNKQLQRATKLTSQSPTPTPTSIPVSKDSPFMTELKNKQNEMKNKRESSEFKTNSLMKKVENPKDNIYSSNSVLEQALNNRRKSIANDDDEENNDVWNTNDEYKTNSLSLPIAEPVDDEIIEVTNAEPKKSVENRINQNKLSDLYEQYNALYSAVDANAAGIKKETQRTIRSQKGWNEKIAELKKVGEVVIIKRKKK